MDYIFEPGSVGSAVVPLGEACTITSSCGCLTYTRCTWPNYIPFPICIVWGLVC